MVTESIETTYSDGHKWFANHTPPTQKSSKKITDGDRVTISSAAAKKTATNNPKQRTLFGAMGKGLSNVLQGFGRNVRRAAKSAEAAEAAEAAREADKKEAKRLNQLKGKYGLDEAEANSWTGSSWTDRLNLIEKGTETKLNKKFMKQHARDAELKRSRGGTKSKYERGEEKKEAEDHRDDQKALLLRVALMGGHLTSKEWNRHEGIEKNTNWNKLMEKTSNLKTKWQSVTNVTTYANAKRDISDIEAEIDTLNFLLGNDDRTVY